MNTDTRHFLVIDKGEPYKTGESIQLSSKETLIPGTRTLFDFSHELVCRSI